MDLRGYGGSDKTPNGYDPVTLAQDVSGVVKALGARDAVLVGHGWGGYVGWATAALHPREVSALCAVSAPHPLAMLARACVDGRRGRRCVTCSPCRCRCGPSAGWPPGGGLLAEHLRSWSAPGSAFPTDGDVATYQRAMGIWPAPHCALEYHRWLVRSRVRAGRPAVRPADADPRSSSRCCCVTGGDGPGRARVGRGRGPARWTGPDLVHHVMPGVGHFPHEEDPAAVHRRCCWPGSRRSARLTQAQSPVSTASSG